MTQGMSGGFFLPAQRSVHCKGGFFASDARAQVPADRLFKPGPHISVAPPLEKARGGGNQAIEHGGSMLFTPSLPTAAAAKITSGAAGHTSAIGPERKDAVAPSVGTAERGRSQGRLRTTQVADARASRRTPTPPSYANVQQLQQRTSAPRDVHSKFEIAMQELNEIKNEYDLKNKRQNSAPVLVEAGRVRVGTANSVADSQSRGNEPPAKTPSDQPQQVTAPVDTNRDLASPRQRLQVAEMVMRKLYKRNLETEKEVASWKAKFEALEKQRQETSAVPESNRLVRSAESHVCHVCEERARQAQVLVLTPPPTAATLARIDNQQLEYLRHLAAEQDKTITALKIRIEELSNQITQNHSNEGRSGSKDRVAGGKKSSKGTVTPRQALSRLQTKLNEALSESERQKNNYLKMKRDFQHLMAVKTKSLCENPSLLHANARELIQLMEKKLQQLDNEQAVSASLYNSKLYEVEQQTCDSYVQKRLVEEELQRVARDVQARDAVDVQIEQCMMGVFERLHQVEVENMQLKQLSAQTLRATTVPLNDVASKQPQQ